MEATAVDRRLGAFLLHLSAALQLYSQQRDPWSDVVVRSCKKAPARAPCGVSSSVGIPLSNKYSALSMTVEPLDQGPADPKVSPRDAAPSLTDTTAFPPLMAACAPPGHPASGHPASGRPAPCCSPPSPRPSAQRRRLLKDVVRCHTRRPHPRVPDGEGGSDGFHLNRAGTRVLAANLAYSLQHTQLSLSSHHPKRIPTDLSTTD
ncbi:Hypothetical predicted protein [Xyrichtys novacula]|uniref:Uncharacterized protein n=1 Tax=Xyrichtys novacula TaxID=13765 RepID=A0AAV1EXL8_XYRNO|nr:Hypothetical predicted protein [Xyrichtys novacula]